MRVTQHVTQHNAHRDGTKVVKINCAYPVRVTQQGAPATSIMRKSEKYMDLRSAPGAREDSTSCAAGPCSSMDWVGWGGVGLGGRKTCVVWCWVGAARQRVGRHACCAASGAMGVGVV